MHDDDLSNREKAMIWVFVILANITFWVTLAAWLNGWAYV